MCITFPPMPVAQCPPCTGCSAMPFVLLRQACVTLDLYRTVMTTTLNHVGIQVHDRPSL
ncbi:unnamed protein product [Periconia digitata]|uniref:Uncharacterized protein n=1 Tax=Periconia digitata TaxID=1303443 RepID=A0A9W4U3R4_9PLEO|nr:unnamed protein product [Periconia digitata]